MLKKVFIKDKELGKGKEGKTFLVYDNKGKKYAMKTFRKNKSSEKIVNEFTQQKKASSVKVAPKPFSYNLNSKWIVMETMDSHLYEQLQKEILLTKTQQKRLIDIFKKLDEVKVFHNDANLCNYMIRKGEIYLIDYGMAKEITPRLEKKLKTNKPNYRLMTIGLILKLKEKNLPIDCYKYLLKHVSKEDKINFNL